MKLAELAALYALVGLGCATAVLARRRTAASLLDAGLLVPFWPLLGPFLLLRASEAPIARRPEQSFLVALEHAGRGPLGALLPAPETIRKLADRLAIAAAKVDEIDALLRRPGFRADEATAHLLDLERRGASETARASAALRVGNLRRLAALRDRFAAELDDIRELMAQLETQVEVVRYAGTIDPTTAELLSELVARVEGLDEVLDDGSGAGHAT